MILNNIQKKVKKSLEELNNLYFPKNTLFNSIILKMTNIEAEYN